MIDETQHWRDGSKHTIGPISIRYTGLGDNGPEGICTVETEAASFTLDWLCGEAMAFCIAPTHDLWLAYESDRKRQARGADRRGWLRFKLTNDKQRLGSATCYAGMHFPLARLVTDAGVGEIVRHRRGERSTDYLRSSFEKVAGPASATTRWLFLDACATLARSRHSSLPAGWREEAKGRWTAADQAYQFASDPANDLP